MTDDEKETFSKEFRDIFIDALNQVVIPRLDRIGKDLVMIRNDLREIKTTLKQTSSLNLAVGI